jgi:hypothetical protein
MNKRELRQMLCASARRAVRYEPPQLNDVLSVHMSLSERHA